MLAQVENDKNTFYILLISSMVIFLILVFNLLRIVMPINPKILIAPDKYEIVSKDEAELIRYLKKDIELMKLDGNEDDNPKSLI